MQRVAKSGKSSVIRSGVKKIVRLKENAARKTGKKTKSVAGKMVLRTNRESSRISRKRTGGSRKSDRRKTPGRPKIARNEKRRQRQKKENNRKPRGKSSRISAGRRTDRRKTRENRKTGLSRSSGVRKI